MIPNASQKCEFMREQMVIDTKTRRLRLGTLDLPCRIGKAGAIPMADGREGDAKTPLGEYQLRFGFYRADRLPRPRSPLTFRPLREDDGWCDAPNDPAYNRFIRLPYTASHETLWREDGAYDIILVMSHNDSPPIANLGSAVFIHIAQPDDRKTLGCIALAPEEMVQLLPHLKMGMGVRII
jgi:L,D-peptidoglycan transpeptidase YkuD (ErfK/YbiS/YcfS/YnhG family)